MRPEDVWLATVHAVAGTKLTPATSGLGPMPVPPSHTLGLPVSSDFMIQTAGKGEGSLKPPFTASFPPTS